MMDSSRLPSEERALGSSPGPNGFPIGSMDWSSIFPDAETASDLTRKRMPVDSLTSLSSRSPLQSKNPFRNMTSSSPQHSLLGHDPVVATLPVLSDTETELASLEAKELQVERRLIQLRRQQLLGKNRNTKLNAVQLTPYTNATALLIDSARTEHYTPNYMLQADRLLTYLSSDQTTLLLSPSESQGGTDMTLPHQERLNENVPLKHHEVSTSRASVVEGTRGEFQPQHSVQIRQRISNQGSGYLGIDSSLVQNLTPGQFEPKPELPSKHDHQERDRDTYEDQEVVGNEHSQNLTNLNPSSKEMRSTGPRPSQEPHPSIEDYGNALSGNLKAQLVSHSSLNDNSHDRTQRTFSSQRTGDTIDHHSPRDTVDCLSSIADPLLSPSTETQTLSSDNFGSFITPNPPTSVARSNPSRLGTFWEKDTIQCPLGNAKPLPMAEDELVALEIAAKEEEEKEGEEGEEAMTYVQNNRLEDLHPSLREQSVTAMRACMPIQHVRRSLDGERPRRSSEPTPIKSESSLRRLQPENSPEYTEPNEILPNNPVVNHSKNTRKQKKSHVTTKPTSTDQDGRSGASFRESIKQEQDSFRAGDETSLATTQGEDTCDCGKARLTTDECYFCWPCDGTIFCRECRDRCPPHKKRRFGMSHTAGLLHEKSDPAMARRIFETLQADHSIEQQALLHVEDEDTSWFGTGEDQETGDFVFQDFGCYARLMVETSTQYRRVRYPTLVSFVGQTGAGKSSLIRLLIQACVPDNVQPQVPVVGSTLHADLPTSGDVHLYADMKTIHGDQPILYADCEGLDGGERQPMGARSRNKDKTPTVSKDRTQSFTKHIRRQHHTSEREISWANTAQTRSREYHVRHLYPRLLYTFSDVIVL